MSHFEVHFEGAKTFLTPLIVLSVAFYLNAELDPDLDSQTPADPDPEI